MITPSSSDYTCAQVYVKDGKRRISSIRITSTNNILVMDNNRDNTARFKINTNKQDKEEENDHVSLECKRTNDKKDQNISKGDSTKSNGSNNSNIGIERKYIKGYH